MWDAIREFFTETTIGKYLRIVLFIIIFLTIFPTLPGDVVGFIWKRVTLGLGHFFVEAKELLQWIIAGFVLYMFIRFARQDNRNHHS